jgi:hypothetical protein
MSNIPLEPKNSGDRSNGSCVPLIGVMHEGHGENAVSNVLKAHAYDYYDYELVWLFTRELIGHSLRRRYEAPKELPRELLELVRKLDAGGNYACG